MDKGTMGLNGGTGDRRQQYRIVGGDRMNRRLGERTSSQQLPQRLGLAVLSSSTLGQFMPSVPVTSSALKQVKSSSQNNPSVEHHKATEKPEPVAQTSILSSFDASFPSLGDSACTTSDSATLAPSVKADWAIKAAQRPIAPTVRVDERRIERDKEEQELARLRELIPKKSPVLHDKKLVASSAIRSSANFGNVHNVMRAFSKPSMKEDDIQKTTIAVPAKKIVLASNRPKLRSSLRSTNNSSSSSINSNSAALVAPPSPPLSSRSVFTPTPPPMPQTGQDRDSDSATSVHDQIDARIQADLDEWGQSDDYEHVGATDYLSPTSSFSSPTPFDRSASASPLALAMNLTNSYEQLYTRNNTQSCNVSRKKVGRVESQDSGIWSNEDDWKELSELLLSTSIGQPELDVSDQPLSPNVENLLETSWGSGNGLWSDEASSRQPSNWEESSYSGWSNNAFAVCHNHNMKSIPVSSSSVAPAAMSMTQNGYRDYKTIERMSLPPHSIPTPINTTIATTYFSTILASGKGKLSPQSASTSSTSRLVSPVDPWFTKAQVSDNSISTVDKYGNNTWMNSVVGS